MLMRLYSQTILATTAFLAAGSNALPAADISFRNDVQVAIAKAGCNLGTCHGNATGKGGFKTSLRGDDPVYDYAALIQDAGGRRVNMFEPDRSLLLLKATQSLAHEGGKRFSADSWEYKVVRDWIAQGAKLNIPGEITLTKLEVTPREQILVEPANKVQLKATVTFSDGSQRDVTSQAVYESAEVGQVKLGREGQVERLKNGESTILVRYLNKQQAVRLAFVPARPDFVWQPTQQNNFIDRHVFAKLRSLRTNPSALCSDEVFARRAYLDLHGVPPTVEEAIRFVADKSPDKRDRLVERLMARTEFADFWSLKWADTLRVESRTMDEKGMTVFHAWIRDAVARNVPVNQFAHDILAAQGSTYKVPQANFYRALREQNPRAEAIAQVFLGTRLKCAQCHNHPFDKWTQDDYFNWSAVFSRVDYKVIENNRKDKNDLHEFKGEQIVQLVKEVKLMNPRTGDPAEAKLLGDMKLDGKTLAETGDLSAAADWVSNPKNTLFAQAQINRIWFHLMGRGLVDPVDDFRATNPASHPALLKELSDEFVESGFDMRHMIRLIMNSRTYQLSSEPNGTNKDDLQNYSHALVRRLTAEQLFDSLHQFTGVRPTFTGNTNAVRSSQLAGPLSGQKAGQGAGGVEAFLTQFGQPPRLVACECERTNETTMGQAFTLISGPRVNTLLKNKYNRLSWLLNDKKSDEEILDTLYWSALTRRPSEQERSSLLAIMKAAPDKRAVMEDISWSLVNAKEFVLRK